MAGGTIESAMAFRTADQIFYRGVHKELFALIATQTLGEEHADRYGEYTEVKVTVPEQPHVHTVPEMEVKLFGPEDPLALYRLPVLGVKLDLDAQRWLRAKDIHPARAFGGSAGIIARPFRDR